MDLSATELVVLSACETGVGEVRSGEGVFGLRRAFAHSGAENLLMSLWLVQDASAVDQMKYFYTSLREMAPGDALRAARKTTCALPLAGIENTVALSPQEEPLQSIRGALRGLAKEPGTGHVLELVASPDHLFWPLAHSFASFHVFRLAGSAR